jgi:hypothetical protein
MILVFHSPVHNARKMKWKNGGVEVSETKKKYEPVFQNIRIVDNFGSFPYQYI